jgi:hypothetical protein
MQQFARDKFSIMEQSDARYSYEQDIDLKHTTSSRPRTMLYLELGIGVLLVVLIINQVAWTITGTIGVIAIVLAFLWHFGSRWLTEGAVCTKVEINKHKNRIKITTFQRDADGQIWQAMVQAQNFDIAYLKHLVIMHGEEMKDHPDGMKQNFDEDAVLLGFYASDHHVPVILYIAPTIDEVQRIKDQLEALHAAPYQMMAN